MSKGHFLFLDIDGVLVHEGYSGEADGEELWSDRDFDPAAIAVLNAICERSGAEVVISSSWRRNFRLDELRLMLARRGFRGDVAGATPSLYRSPLGARLERGDEIQAWLDERGDVRGFAILDDDDMAHLRPFVVRTSMAAGLRPEHLGAALSAFEASARALARSRDGNGRGG